MHFHLKWSWDDENFIFINFVALALHFDVAYEKFSLDKIEIAFVEVYCFVLDCRVKWIWTRRTLIINLHSNEFFQNCPLFSNIFWPLFLKIFFDRYFQIYIDRYFQIYFNRYFFKYIWTIIFKNIFWLLFSNIF